MRRLTPNPSLWLLAVLAAAVPLGAQTVSEQYLLAAANADRAAHGVQPVHLDAHLALAARTHAYEMARHGTISHQFAGEPALAERGSSAGAHFSLISENVAEASNSALIHDLWMHSAGHRANLLDPSVDSVGIAVVQQRGQLYAVEDFSRAVTELSFREQENAVGSLLAAQGLTLLPSDADARETCAMPTGHAGSRQPWFIMRYTSADIGMLPPELTSKIATGKYRRAAVGACSSSEHASFTAYHLAILLYP